MGSAEAALGGLRTLASIGTSAPSERAWWFQFQGGWKREHGQGVEPISVEKRLAGITGFFRSCFHGDVKNDATTL
jgi:hypothetical protein